MRVGSGLELGLTCVYGQSAPLVVVLLLTPLLPLLSFMVMCLSFLSVMGMGLPLFMDHPYINDTVAKPADCLGFS